ncbi:FAS-associated death domain protein [Anomaloglossus baeobatrachus]|uniref:FAS-associated death domain protein n=1 Tax=Anomaloglossus baeobatrachus TaxID=238106 RepID=UPI003F509927
MDKFSILLLNISQKLNERELASLKFLCHTKIVKKKMEQITSPLHLFTNLKELTEISEDDLSVLISLLTAINRNDLAEEVELFQGPQPKEEAKERDQLDEAFDIICDNVSKEWRRLIRKLGLSETVINQVIYANQNNLREQLMQCLLEWRRIKKGSATVSALVEALEDCKLRLVAEILTDAINLSHGTS